LHREFPSIYDSIKNTNNLCKITKLNSSFTGTTEYDLLKPAALRDRISPDRPHPRANLRTLQTSSEHSDPFNRWNQADP
jgi:hypothetical protein